MWPYPTTAQNLLKVFADAEIFFVALIGLTLRVTDSAAGNFADYTAAILVALLALIIDWLGRVVELIATPRGVA